MRQTAQNRSRPLIVIIIALRGLVRPRRVAKLHGRTRVTVKAELRNASLIGLYADISTHRYVLDRDWGARKGLGIATGKTSIRTVPHPARDYPH